MMLRVGFSPCCKHLEMASGHGRGREQDIPRDRGGEPGEDHGHLLRLGGEQGRPGGAAVRLRRRGRELRCTLGRA